MSKNEKTALVPRLRFPEFRDFSEWVKKPLGKVTYTISNRNSKAQQYPIYSINNKEGFLPQAEQFEGVDSKSRGYDISLYKIVDKNTFAYNPARINVGSIGYSGELYNIIISSLYVCFKTTDEIDDKFFQYFLDTSTFTHQVENHTEGGIRSYLFYENFSKILFQYPHKNEQQKIADCLSSLDDLITAEDKKLSSLRLHKKGLMQKLFPAEGETVPEWRFPEFRDSGEWEVKLLSQLCDICNNRRKPVSGSDRVKGNYPYYGASGIVDYINDYIFDESLILVGEDGAKWGANEKTAFIARGKYWVNNHAHVLKPIDIDCTLLENYLIMLDMTPFITGAAPPKLTLGKLKEIPIPFPANPQEQQKIADCLSSLDTLITAQEEKIESLKAHKKGLLQGLFPSIEEVGI